MTSHPSLILEASCKKEKVVVSLFERGSPMSQYEDVTVSLQDIGTICANAIRLFNKANELGRRASGLSSELKKCGQLLHDQLLPVSVQHKLQNTRAVNLIVLIDENLVQIPWELLYDGRQFLCLRFNLGRSVKTRQTLRERDRRSVSSPAKILILADPTGDLASARKEARVIRNDLDKDRKSIAVCLKAQRITPTYVKKNIRDYDVIHYAGHTVYDFQDPSDSSWILVDGKFTAKDVMKMGSTGSLPLLIFSNSCQSAHEKEWKIEEGFENKFFGLANAFLLSGVKHFIGSLWKIPDEISLVFAKEFYHSIAQKQSVGKALKQARIEVLNAFGEDNLVWASYILYGDPAETFLPQMPELSSLSPQAKKKKRSLTLFFFALTVIVGLSVYIYVMREPSKNPAITQGSPKAEQITEKAESYYAIGEYRKAAQSLDEASILFEDISDKGSLVDAKARLVGILLRIDQDQEAQRHIGEIFEIARELNSERMKLSGYEGLAFLHLKNNQRDRAERTMEEISEIVDLLESRGSSASALRHDYRKRINVYYLNNPHKAVEYAQKYLKHKGINKDPHGLYADYQLLSNVYAAVSDYRAAVSYHQKALKIAFEMEDRKYTAEAYLFLADRYTEEMLYAFVQRFGNGESSLNAEGADPHMRVGGQALPDFLDQVIDLYDKSLEQASDPGSELIQAHAFKGLAYIHTLKAYHNEEAILHYEKALRIFEGQRYLDLLNKLELTHIYLDLARLYVTNDEPNFVNALSCLIKLNHTISLRDDSWSLQKEPLEIIRKNYEYFLKDLSAKEYENKKFYSEVERAYKEFKSNIKPILPK